MTLAKSLEYSEPHAPKTDGFKKNNYLLCMNWKRKRAPILSDINLSIEKPAICPEEVTSASVVLATALRIALTTPVGL